HAKHGVAALILGILALLGAWMSAGRKTSASGRAGGTAEEPFGRWSVGDTDHDAMKGACAECGCIGDHGARVQTCDRTDCCCTDAPVHSADRAAAATTPATARQAEQHSLSPGLDLTFKIGLLLKAADGVLEIVGGLLLLFVSPAQIEHIVR